MPLEETPLEPSLGPRHMLGYVLRLLRHENDKSLTEVAELLQVSFQTVSNWEHARAMIDIKYARTLDELWGTGGLLQIHHGLALADKKPRQFGTFTRHESHATGMRIYSNMWVPGLLQTPEYARASLVIYDPRDLDQSVKERLDRQQALTRDNPPKMWVVLDEGVLDRPVGSREIMCDQINRLIELGESPKISLRVIPRDTGAYQGLDGEFHLLAEGGKTVAFITAPGGGFLVQGGARVETFVNRWESIGVHALTWDRSKELLMRALEAHS